MIEYNKGYWEYQSRIGEFGGWANLSKFQPYIVKEDEVLDFGCGGGFLLSQISASLTEGLEINPEARRCAESFGIDVFSSIEEIPDDRYSIIISNHALEHCERPLDEIRGLLSKLKNSGRIVFYTPSESYRCGYREGDPNQHLYTWSPQNLGNLFCAAGFKVIEARAYIHRWPPKYMLFRRFLGRFGFEISCRIYGYMRSSKFSQVRCVAMKDGDPQS